MSQRLDNTKWLWCLLALHVGSVWGNARPVTVRTPPNNPSTIEAQAKFFQYRNLPKADQFDQGHRLGSDRHFTERHERAKPSEGVFSAKVRWGDKKGGYGEHYWDLNHAGNTDNIGDDGDDGSYHEKYDHYDEPSNNSPNYGHDDDSPTYGNDDYDAEKASYEERERAKRAYPKSERPRKTERKHVKPLEQEPEEEHRPKKQSYKKREEQEAAETSHEEEYDDDEDEESYERTEKPKTRRQHHKKKEDDPKPKEKNQIVLVVSHKDDAEDQPNQYANQNQPEQSQYQQTQNQPALNQYLPQNQAQLPPYLPQQPTHLPQYAVPKQHLEPPQFVPYEGGAGVRQHQQPEVSAATTVPRLFLEPSTGHVVDRATGQAYVLQPIATHNNYN